MGHRIAKHVGTTNTANTNPATNFILESSTYYVLDAQGNTMSVYERTVNGIAASIKYEQAEKHIYGSSRLGVMNVAVNLLGTAGTAAYSQTNWTHRIGQRTYELANHLGNVLSVISDKVIPHVTGSTVAYYKADILQAQDYSPFGVTLKNRGGKKTVLSDKFRFGFNGMEADDEMKGNGNSYDFGARMLDSRLGRWLTVNKRFKEYSCFSPYNFGLNNPIYYVDKDGNVIWDPVNKEEVKVTYDKKGKPTFLLSNGKPVSHKFFKQSIGIFTSLSKSEQGKQVITEMMNVPTKIVIKEEGRPTPNGTVNERSSGIEPKADKNGEAEMTKEGFFEEVTITPYTNFIRKNAIKNNIEFDELLLGVLTVEIGHFSTTVQIEKEFDMQAAGFVNILPEASIPNLQQKTKENYEPLFNQAAIRQYLYRLEKNIPIDGGISIIGTGAKSKMVNRAFETTEIITPKQIETILKAVDILSKIK